eukprot:GDKJ01014594.1.p1 GENE.GDKJ01014594.1~~GDKJ01014594.1.p1  ORF type:complete len:456 (+),score=87.24 GDKJ01014594.1:45-1412(+)
MSFSDSFRESDGPTLFFIALGTSSLFFMIYMAGPFILKKYINDSYDEALKSTRPKSLDQCRFEWCSRLVSTIFTCFAFPVALAVVVDPTFRSLPFSHTTVLSKLLLCIASGYFIFDTVISLLFDSWVFVVHGVYCLISFTWVLFEGPSLVCWYLASCLLMEGSTIFMQMRWFMLQRKLSKTRLFSVVQVLFAASFITIRVGWTLYLAIQAIYDFYCRERVKDPIPEQTIPSLGFRVYATFGILLGLGLNLMWTHAIVKAALRGKSKNKATTTSGESEIVNGETSQSERRMSSTSQAFDSAQETTTENINSQNNNVAMRLSSSSSSSSSSQSVLNNFDRALSKTGGALNEFMTFTHEERASTTALFPQNHQYSSFRTPPHSASMTGESSSLIPSNTASQNKPSDPQSSSKREGKVQTMLECTQVESGASVDEGEATIVDEDIFIHPNANPSPLPAS